MVTHPMTRLLADILSGFGIAAVAVVYVLAPAVKWVFGIN